MLFQWIRLLRKDDSVVSDYSLDNQDDSLEFNAELIVGEDAFYLGKRMRFNNFFVHLGTANASSVNMKVSLWDGSEFVEANDVLDASKGLKQSGVVQFAPDENQVWQIEDTDDIAELSDYNIDNMYWIKIEFDASVDAGTTIKEIGYAFTTSQQLKQIDACVDDYLSHFNQSDWIPQIMLASLELAIDLKARGLIVDEGQIIRFDDFSLAAAYKSIELIYFNLGPDFDERRKIIINKYKHSLKTRRMTIDLDGDGQEDTTERNGRIRTGCR
jgi:hypothetical protein